MTDALHRLIEVIAANRFHNHRGHEHSTLLCEFMLADLAGSCEVFQSDIMSGHVRNFGGSKTPGARGRRADLVVAIPSTTDPKLPDFSKLRLCVENKSVVTAHRNAPARYDDLTEVLRVLHAEQPEAIFVATVLIGTSPRYLNVNDGVKRHFRGERAAEFENRVLPRLSTGDPLLWTEFEEDVSENKPGDPTRSVAVFQGLPVRNKAQTHKVGYDFVLIVPVEVDNVNPPRLSPPGTLGIDAVSDYDLMIAQICETYRVRWPAVGPRTSPVWVGTHADKPLGPPTD